MVSPYMQLGSTGIPPSSTERTVAAGRASLAGKRRGVAAFLPFVGPAVIASVAYMDPGNIATNIEAGARFGYLLLWVVLSANLIAMLLQGLSAKLGIVTGFSLAELCRQRFPSWLVYAMWIVSEIGAMATDLAEFLGGAIGLSLLFGWPLVASLLVTGAVTYGLLIVQGHGFRPIEVIIAGFIAIIGASYAIELIIAPPDVGAFLYHSVVPRLEGSRSVLLAVGILGATVMPHAIYLHSSLTKDRIPLLDDSERRRAVRYSNLEVVLALSVAGLVNMAMIAMAAAVFFATGHPEVAEIETAYKTLGPLFGASAAGVFMVSLFASGLSSSVVGTMAGQIIMQDFISFRLPLALRRLVTMIPAFVVVALGVNATQALVVSQVVLSMVLPVPMIALLVLTARRDVMGEFANSKPLIALTVVAGVVVLSMNLLLLLSFAGLELSWFGID
jgi:manganese transport protein